MAVGAGLQAYNKIFPRGGDMTLPFGITAQIAESAGLPGITFAQIAKGESSFRPGAVGDDAAAGFGNTFGLGMWQITTGVGNDDIIQRFGGEAAMFNPFNNARAAKAIYDAQGLGAWYGDQYVTDPNAHWRGATGGRLPAWGGWHRKGGEFTTRPGQAMVFGAGEGLQKEDVSIRPRKPKGRMAHKQAGGGGRAEVTVNFNGSVNVRNDGDLNAIADKIGRKLLTALDRNDSPDAEGVI